jgi:hypothetical protein
LFLAEYGKKRTCALEPDLHGLGPIGLAFKVL